MPTDPQTVVALLLVAAAAAVWVRTLVGRQSSDCQGGGCSGCSRGEAGALPVVELSTFGDQMSHDSAAPTLAGANSGLAGATVGLAGVNAGAAGVMAMASEPFRPQYLRVWLMMFRNSISREMSFRGNFVIELLTNAFWFAAQWMLFDIIFGHVSHIRDWTREQYFGFMATGMLINSLVEFLFMPNCANFSELVRTGNLDFVLLKPMDSQFLVSLQTVDLGMISEMLLASLLLGYSVSHATAAITLPQVAVYLGLLLTGAMFLYSLMISLASLAVWFGRNTGVYDFWFYVTVFGRYPGDVYRRSPLGNVLWFAFSFVIPILVVITVPARILLGKTLDPDWRIALVSPVAAVLALWVSRRIFLWSLDHYRSASS